MKRMLCSLALAATLATPAAAQDDDRGYLTALLEDNLSGAGRDVTITGFAGVLFAHKMTFISPAMFTLQLSIEFIIVILIGGTFSLHGAVLGAIFLWYHPSGEPPQWELPDIFGKFPQFDTDPDAYYRPYPEFSRRADGIHVHPQIVAENAPDSSHFRYVHGATVTPAAAAPEVTAAPDEPLSQ